MTSLWLYFIPGSTRSVTRRFEEDKMGNSGDLANFKYAVNLIHYKVKQMIGVLGFTFNEREDLEQELTVHLLRNWPRFDSGRGATKTFINCVLDNRIRQMIDKRKSSKAGFGTRTVSLDIVVADRGGGLVRLVDSIDHDEYMQNLGRLRRSVFDECDLRLDVERVMGMLAPELRELCNRLRTQTLSEISEEVGVPRHCLYTSIRKLRCIFEEAGLRDYL
jgi:RNA polymerase sigma-70 factor (ECF subfamily)